MRQKRKKRIINENQHYATNQHRKIEILHSSKSPVKNKHQEQRTKKTGDAEEKEDEYQRKPTLHKEPTQKNHNPTFQLSPPLKTNIETKNKENEGSKKKENVTETGNNESTIMRRYKKYTNQTEAKENAEDKENTD